jgi:uncharacterized membrane protein
MQEQKIKSARIKYIDYLRAWSVLFMIFSHVKDVILLPELKGSVLFYVTSFIEGLVAPAFLFAAGASFSIIMMKRKTEILSYKLPAFKQLGRALQIIIIAYALHLPFRTMHQCMTIMTENQLIMFFRSDILHVIGIGLILCQLFFLITRKENIFFSLLISISILIIIITPFIWDYDFRQLFPLGIATFFNPKYFAVFPLFHWLSYLFLGSVIMYYLQQNANKGKEDFFLKRICIAGIIFILMGTIPELLKIETTPYYNFWKSSPNIFFIRIGFIFVLLYSFHYFEKRFKYNMKIFGVFGRESLLVYVLHLILVYGSVLGLGFLTGIAGKADWLIFFGIYMLINIVMLVAAFIWNKIKTTKIIIARVILIFMTLYFAIYFLTQPF